MWRWGRWLGSLPFSAEERSRSRSPPFTSSRWAARAARLESTVEQQIAEAIMRFVPTTPPRAPPTTATSAPMTPPITPPLSEYGDISGDESDSYSSVEFDISSSESSVESPAATTATVARTTAATTATAARTTAATTATAASTNERQALSLAFAHGYEAGFQADAFASRPFSDMEDPVRSGPPGNYQRGWEAGWACRNGRSSAFREPAPPSVVEYLLRMCNVSLEFCPVGSQDHEVGRMARDWLHSI